MEKLLRAETLVSKCKKTFSVLRNKNLEKPELKQISTDLLTQQQFTRLDACMFLKGCAEMRDG